MPNWTGFTLAIAVLTLVLLGLTRRSQAVLENVRVVDDVTSRTAPGSNHDADSNSGVRSDPSPTITTRLLLANVAVSQGLFLAAVVALVWWYDVPAATLGLPADPIAVRSVGYGVLAGAAVAVLNELGAGIGRRVGLPGPERLRESLAPTDAVEWAVLLVVVLPTIAVFEELLFRGVLIGAFATGLGIDPWLLVVGSAIVFGIGHGAQGRLGVVVTAVLGTVLGGLFVRSGSLVVVIVAHYVINAVEFVVHEGPGPDIGTWFGR
ncbi:CPBP family intramembrane glutamic endopeptidase [Halopenitus persicus]|uniref:Membrane protease YdiL, CAAX protease family n=1 Tax=Halopenitus persicus TaxID=1048396 RepID=A0A1H3GG16_9EURY|nr:CPBP family intramembrane glutamic endopeptidase [Halopenitus persicus]SDY01434.1 Membrane protease YdiL, CAAX protease family [Halopenitus persicus]